MRISAQELKLKARIAGGLMLTAMLTTPQAAFSEIDVTASGAAPSTATISATDTSAAQYSTGVREVLKMVQAKVDSGVIKTFIQSSPTTYHLSATDIIALKQQGVPDDLLMAMLQRGTEVRTQLAQAAQGQGMQPNPEAAALYTPAPAYPYDYGASPMYSDYGYGYPSYAYDYGSPYGYPYGYNYWWSNYGYPWGFYSPFFGYNFYGRNHLRDFDRFGHHGFQNGHAGRFAAGGARGSPYAPLGARGFVNRGSPFAPLARSASPAFAIRGAFAPTRGFASRPSGGVHSMGGAGGRSSFAAHMGGGGGHAMGRR